MLASSARRLYNFQVKPKLQHRVDNGAEDKRPSLETDEQADRPSQPYRSTGKTRIFLLPLPRECIKMMQGSICEPCLLQLMCSLHDTCLGFIAVRPTS